MVSKSYIFTIQLGLNKCIDLRSSYSVFQYYKPHDIYHYGSKQRRLLKHQYGLTGKVDDHHLIPKKFSSHPVILDTNFPIHCSKNIKMMPNFKFQDLPPEVLVHKSHPAYNHYVYKLLEDLKKFELSEQRNRLVLIVKALDVRLDYSNCIPW